MSKSTNEQPLVTIVTPSYNQGKFIEQTILSVLSQDYPHIEYIIIDGGSTDNTNEIVNAYKDKIDVFISEPDRGQSHAINKGFKRAKGQILAWINSDDYYYPDAVSHAVKAFEDNPRADVIYGNCVFTDEEGQFLRYYTEIRNFNKSKLLNDTNFIMQPATFFKKEAIENIHFLKENLNFTMDWDLWCRLVEAGCCFAYEPHLFAVNREYYNTKTSSGKLKRLHEIYKTNNYHKTQMIPRGALSFGISEFLSSFIDINSSRKKISDTLRPLKRIIFGEKQHQNLYGLEAHGSRLDRKFQIKFPWYSAQPRAVELSFSYKGRGISELELFLNHEKIPEKQLTLDNITNFTLTVRKEYFKQVINVRGKWKSRSDSQNELKLEYIKISQ